MGYGGGCSETAGQGSGGVWGVWDCGLLRESVSAKVLGRAFMASSVVVAVVGGGNADSGSGSGFVSLGGAEGLLNGLLGLANGLLLLEDETAVENGFAKPDEDPNVLAPKRVSPRLDGGWGFGAASFGFGFSSFVVFAATFTVALPGVIRTLRRDRMLPSLRRQLLRRQEKTYSRRS